MNIEGVTHRQQLYLTLEIKFVIRNSDKYSCYESATKTIALIINMLGAENELKFVLKPFSCDLYLDH